MSNDLFTKTTGVFKARRCRASTFGSSTSTGRLFIMVSVCKEFGSTPQDPLDANGLNNIPDGDWITGDPNNKVSVSSCLIFSLLRVF